MKLKDIITKYCSYDIGHPLVIKHYGSLVNYLNNELYNKNLDKNDYNIYLSLVKKQLGEIPSTGLINIVERYRSKYYNGKNIEFMLEGLSAKDVLSTSKLCNQFCYYIAEGFKNKRFSENNKTAKAIAIYLCGEIKDRRTSRDNYWFYVNTLKVVLPMMLKYKYVYREDVQSCIKILKALLKEEGSIEDDFYNLKGEMNSFEDVFNINDYTYKLNLDLISAFLDSEDLLLTRLKEETYKDLGNLSNSDKDKVTAVLQNARERFVGRPHRRFNMYLFRNYCDLKQLDVKYPWLYCYTYPDYVLVETFKVLDAFRKDFTEDGVFKVLIDMYIVNAGNLLENLPNDTVRKVTMDNFKECLDDLIRSKVIAIDLRNKVMEAFEKVYDYYYGGNKDGK